MAVKERLSSDPHFELLLPSCTYLWASTVFNPPTLCVRTVELPVVVLHPQFVCTESLRQPPAVSRPIIPQKPGGTAIPALSMSQ